MQLAIWEICASCIFLWKITLFELAYHVSFLPRIESGTPFFFHLLYLLHLFTFVTSNCILFLSFNFIIHSRIYSNFHICSILGSYHITMLDITYIVHVVTRGFTSCSIVHWTSVLRILRCLWGTQFNNLLLRSSYIFFGVVCLLCCWLG